MFPYGFWVSPIWKNASRAGFRQISKMIGQGNLSGASQLAKTPGVLKPSLAGSQLRHLGRGGEGLATMVAHPEHGIAVRKLYDPRGISSHAMISRKEEVGKALGNNPNFASFLGTSPTPHGQGTMHFSEYVPTAPGAPATNEWTPQSLATSQEAHKALSRLNYEGHDIRPGNMIRDARTGKDKLIDYIPARSGEMISSPLSPDQIQVTPSGEHLFNSPRVAESTTGGLLGRMLGNKGPVRPNISNYNTLGKTRSIGTAPTLPSGNINPTNVQKPMPAPVLTRPLKKPVQPATVPLRRGSL